MARLAVKTAAWLRRNAVRILPVTRWRFDDLRVRVAFLEARVGTDSVVSASNPRQERRAGRNTRASVDEQQAEIRRLLASGHRQAEIARRLGVSRQWVHKLVQRGF